MVKKGGTGGGGKRKALFGLCEIKKKMVCHIFEKEGRNWMTWGRNLLGFTVLRFIGGYLTVWFCQMK